MYSSLCIRMGVSEIDEDYLYPGKDNHITLENYLHIKLGCEFDLKW